MIACVSSMKSLRFLNLRDQNSTSRSLASYQDFLIEYLLKIGVVRTVNTSFAPKLQKNTTVLPLDQIDELTGR